MTKEIKHLECLFGRFLTLLNIEGTRVKEAVSTVAVHQGAFSELEAIWTESKIPTEHGQLLYLLTFVKSISEENRVDWVLQNYPLYRNAVYALCEYHKAIGGVSNFRHSVFMQAEHHNAKLRVNSAFRQLLIKEV